MIRVCRMFSTNRILIHPLLPTSPSQLQTPSTIAVCLPDSLDLTRCPVAVLGFFVWGANGAGILFGGLMGIKRRRRETTIAEGKKPPPAGGVGGRPNPPPGGWGGDPQKQRRF